MKVCKCCGSDKIRLLIDFGMQPVAHNLLESKEQMDILTHQLCINYCEKCGFAQIDDPISPEQLYKNYNYCFSSWKRQPQIPLEIELLNKHIENKDIRILEIGCNDAIFLKSLRQAGYKNIVGVEPNPYAADKASEQGFDILNFMFDKESVYEIKNQFEYFDLIVIRHVLEHIPDLKAFFEAINLILGGSRLLFIEVPNFKEALKSGDCSTIWEEHPNYFTYEVLLRLLKEYQIVDNDFYDFSGGSLSVLARKATGSAQSDAKEDLSLYKNFASTVELYKLRLSDVLKKARGKGIRILLYGTGARACTLINGLNLGEGIDCAIDDQKEKQGLYMPGCHLPIMSMNDATDFKGKKIFLLAVNHESEDIVTQNILSLNDEKDICIISLFTPNNIFEEVEKLNEWVKNNDNKRKN